MSEKHYSLIGPIFMVSILAIGAVVGYVVYRAFPSNEAIAEDALSEILKDPSSMQLRNVRCAIQSGSECSMICGEVNAKNSYGGYAGFEGFVVRRVSLSQRPSAVVGGVIYQVSCKK
jgi:hypothetical protein